MGYYCSECGVDLTEGTLVELEQLRAQRDRAVELLKVGACLLTVAEVFTWMNEVDALLSEIDGDGHE